MTKPTDREFVLKNSEPEPNSGCWLWCGYLDERGYARTSGRSEKYVHRLSYGAFVGNIPDDLVVMHLCDMPNCVNPSHLDLGTQGDNVRDSVTKGRWVPARARGEDNGNSKLKEEQVADIRTLGRNLSSYALADVYPVSRSTISRILRGDTWRHVGDGRV